MKMTLNSVGERRNDAQCAQVASSPIRTGMTQNVEARQLTPLSPITAQTETPYTELRSKAIVARV
jgi:hypothetical protein